MKAAVLLSDLATDTLTIVCPKCGYERVLDVGLALKINCDLGLPELLSRATKSCVQRQQIAGRCGAVYGQIVLKIQSGERPKAV